MKNVSSTKCESFNELEAPKKHTWRCKAHVTNLNIHKNSQNDVLTTPSSILAINDNDNRLNYNPHQNEEKDVHCRCCCGRESIIYVGLMTHRRSCFVGEVREK